MNNDIEKLARMYRDYFVNESVETDEHKALQVLDDYCKGIKGNLAADCDPDLEISNRIANFCGWLSTKADIQQLSPVENTLFFNKLQEYAHKTKLTGKKCDPDGISIHSRIANFIGFMLKS